jgi:hypothetical protein
VALDGRGDAPDQLPLGGLGEVALLLGVGHAVAEDLVAPGAELRRDVGAMLVDRDVHLGLDRHAEGIEQLEHPPHADAVAVVPPAVDAGARGLVGRRDRHALADAVAERLDVDRDVPASRRPPAT